MNRLNLLLTSSAVFLSACAFQPAKWTVGDSVRQAVFTASLAADYAQTKSILEDANLRERNDLISRENVEVYFASCALAHWAVSYVLPKRSWREIWQYGWIAAEVGTVAHNYFVFGVKITN